jgi:hypothetical protein
MMCCMCMGTASKQVAATSYDQSATVSIYVKRCLCAEVVDWLRLEVS